MRAADIVAQLAGRLPLLTDAFTEQVTISAISAAGTTVSVTTSADHGLTTGKLVYMLGVDHPIPIATFTRSGTVGTITTSADHDLTLPIAATVVTAGAVEGTFNGTHTTINVVNRRTITVVMADSGATAATGTPLLLDAASIYQRYGGLVEITAVPASDEFEYELAAGLSEDPYPAAGSGIVVKRGPRVASSVSVGRAQEGYTKQTTATRMWAFVVLGDATVSPSRGATTDAAYHGHRGGQSWNQTVVQPFSVYLAIPCSERVSASMARDAAQEMFPIFCRALVGHPLDSQLDNGADFPVYFKRHGFADYTGPVYWHEFEFEMISQLTDADTVGPDDDVAFRDAALTLSLDLGGTGTIEADVDLDDVPL